MPAEKIARFWMVWNPSGHAPRQPHKSRPSADREAARLARLNPGSQFIVLKAVGGQFSPLTQPKAIKFFTSDAADTDEIPF